MELIYIKGDLFKLAPKRAYLVHSCNTQGVWGAGIAKTFKDQFPEDYEEYKEYCEVDSSFLLGRYLITNNNIVCLFASSGFGKNIDSVDKIVEHTYYALSNFIYYLPENSVVYSNKFNSGLFNVPWERTEQHLKYFLERRPDVKWTVVEYEQ